tara:strand:+ start:10191 stop:10742 length:552 start_codon:yes stop_codon:yes gene_type:complete
MEPLEELYLKEYDDYIYKDVEPVIVKPDFIEPDPISQLITDGISGVQSDFEADPAEALYGTGKGVVQGAVGLPGDLISLVRGLVDVAQTPEGKSKLDAFLSGTEKSTGLPTAMDIKMFLEDTLRVPESSAEYAEGLGEVIAPGTVATKTASKVMKVVGKNKAKSLYSATAVAAPKAKQEKVNK